MNSVKFEPKISQRVFALRCKSWQGSNKLQNFETTIAAFMVVTPPTVTKGNNIQGGTSNVSGSRNMVGCFTVITPIGKHTATGLTHLAEGTIFDEMTIYRLAHTTDNDQGAVVPEMEIFLKEVKILECTIDFAYGIETKNEMISKFVLRAGYFRVTEPQKGQNESTKGNYAYEQSIRTGVAK